MVFIIPERRHEIIVSKGADVEIWSAFVVAELDSSVFVPLISVMGEDDFVVVGKGEIDFEDAVTELII